jgi:predicted ABC-type ATPase
MAVSRLVMLAGPNGSGKTTCALGHPIQALITNVRFLNPDHETLNRLRKLGYEGFHDAPLSVQLAQFIASANDVSSWLSEAVTRGEQVGIETVLSTDKYLDLVDQVRSAGGDFELLFIAVNSPELACERVSIRAAKKGHSVPPDKIHDRWYKSIQNLPKFAALAKAFWVFDNSDSNPENAPVMVARGVDGRLVRPPLASFPLLDEQLAQIPIQGQA